MLVGDAADYQLTAGELAKQALSVMGAVDVLVNVAGWATQDATRAERADQVIDNGEERDGTGRTSTPDVGARNSASLIYRLNLC